MRCFVQAVMLMTATGLLADDESGSVSKSTSAALVQNNKAAIEGVWNVMSLEVAGQKPADDAKTKTKSFRVVISDDKLTVFSGARLLSTDTYALDPSTKPASIDIWAAAKQAMGVYELDGDTLKMRFCESKPNRPSKLALEPNWPNDILLVLARSNDQNEINKLRKLAAEANRKEEAKEGDVDVGWPMFVINSDGSGLRKLICRSDFSTTGSPDWSRDGKKIVLDGWRCTAGETYPQAHIITINADGTDFKDLGPGAMPSWSPDGKQIAFSQYGRFGGIWIMNANGSGHHRIAQAGLGVEWSPTGKEVAYATGGNICVLDLAKGTQRLLLKEPQGYPWRGMSWSPDGKQICFKLELPEGTSAAAVVSAEGEENDAKVLYEGELVEVVSWAGKGQSIAIATPSRPGGLFKLHLLDPDGQKPPTLVPDQDPDRDTRDMSWSPDGKQIVYRSRKAKP